MQEKTVLIVLLQCSCPRAAECQHMVGAGIFLLSFMNRFKREVV